jgi:hypothetical protein
MPLELGVWRIDGTLTPVPATGLDLESRLEDFLDQDITIANPGWMVIGRQLRTSFGGIVDLLAIDAVGNLALLELKRDKTPREVMAQVLEYGSWLGKLRAEDLPAIYQAYVDRFHSERQKESLDQAFCRRFRLAEMPEDLNQSHELVVVASQLDATSERIVEYLAETYDVEINAIFFRVFRDADHEYLTRAWLRDPADAEPISAQAVRSKSEWNGEYYVSFGGGRDWEEARRYGYVSGGGGSFYSRTLALLEPGGRVWVNVPGTGYVGVGKVMGAVTPIDAFVIRDGSGRERRLIEESSLKLAHQGHALDKGDMGEYLVPIEWIKTVPVSEAVKERGFFGNQNTVARPRDDRWRHTVERLKQVWRIS